ncbi:MAG TPA: protein kinase [Blastocatellia bacterium]|nr:protein kinase [Blastocatellia bacterium]
MTPERWKQVEEVFQAALDLAPEERARYVTSVCGGDESLKSEVAALLTQYEHAGDLLTQTLTVPGGLHALAALLDDERDPLIGQVLGAYRIEREVGRGGMGTVYEAVRADNMFRRRVAIKLVKRGMDTDFVLRRFRNERQILASLDHPNIARLLDGGTTADGLPYFVMEYIEGQPLYVYSDAERLTINERLRLFLSVCDAIRYAHHKQVIHRDIKPSNILVTDEGVPKLLDFGIAKLLDPELAAETIDMTMTAMRLMTPEYASPEQVKGVPVTPTSDIYALGVLLYELLSGHRPYQLKHRALHEVARVICEEEPLAMSASLTRENNLVSRYDDESGGLDLLYQTRRASLDELRRELAGDLERIIMKALRKAPAERYQTADELREDITRYLEGRPVAAPPYVRSTVAMTRLAQKTKAEELSIAVLPFKLIGPRTGDDTGDEYLGIGLADALVTRLGNVRRFVVRPTSSVLAYSGGDTGDPLAAGVELNVNYIIDGNIRRAGDTLRVTVQLLQVSEGAIRWAGRFDEKLTDVLRLEDSISEQVAVALIPQLTGEEQEQLAKRGTEDAQAFEAYLRGRYYWHSLTEEGFAKAMREYHRAIALDPNYALAYTGIADYYIFLGIFGVLPFAECAAAAYEAAERAIELDNELAEAHSALAFATVCRDFDWQAAERHHQRALELNPNHPNAHTYYSFMLLQTARFDESLAEAERGIELDPVTPLTSMALAWCHYHARRFDEAIEVHRRLIQTEPHFAYQRSVYSWVLRCAGRHTEAIAQAERAVELAGNGQLYVAGAGMAYAAAGRIAEARVHLAELHEIAQSRYVSPYFLAVIYTYLGDVEAALRQIEEAVRIGDAWVSWLVVDPQLDRLRLDTRFQELAQRSNNPAAFAPQT